MNIQGAIDAYLASLNSPHTRHGYSTALRLFCAYLEQRGTNGFPSVDLGIWFVDWIKTHDPPYRKGTIQVYLTAIYRFYRFLLTRGAAFTPADLARLEEVYRSARNIRGEERPTDHQFSAVEAVIRAARRVPASPGHTPEKRRRELARLRDIAIVETLRATGCRVGELVGLRLTDIDRGGRGALVRGKGSKWRHVFWDESAWQALLSYLRARGVSEANHAPVFVSHGNRTHDQALTTRHVSRTIAELARRAGLKDAQVTPHYFRHVFATRALDRTGNLALVQDMLGHASPITTRTYARTDEEQRKQAHAQVWA